MPKKIYRLIAPLKGYLWGGDKLKRDFNKHTSLPCVAESWELACRDDGTNITDDGISLQDLIDSGGITVLGTNCRHYSQFPLLCKLIDAADNLSVQVHPDNEYAFRTEHICGKTEMWYIVDCEPGATIIYGMKQEITKRQFLACIDDGTLLDYVNVVPVKKGDVFFVQAGTLHSIGRGIVAAEVQQNSNAIYRVYDFGRTDSNGKPRPLHIQKAADVTILKSADPTPRYMTEHFSGGTWRQLAICDYFDVKLYTLESSAECTLCNAGSESFYHVLVLDGSGFMADVPFERGNSFFVPANSGVIPVRCAGNSVRGASFMVTSVPEPATKK